MRQVADSESIDKLEQFRARYPNSPHLADLAEKLDNLYWDEATGAGTVSAFEKYLARSPNEKHRGEAQEKLDWGRAEASSTIQAYHDYQGQYPQGPHFELAGRKIEDLRFQATRNSEDEADLQAFLKDYPSGARHDQIFGRLDDLVWEQTNKNDVASLHAYVARMPAGKHISQAEDAMDKLTVAAIPAKRPKPVVDDKAAVLKVIERYIKAYDDESVEELRQIWPGRDKKQISSMRDLFRTAKNLKSNYTLVDELQINGAEATVKIAQVTTYILDGQQQTLSSTRTLKFKPSPGVPGSWEISSVSGD